MANPLHKDAELWERNMADDLFRKVEGKMDEVPTPVYTARQFTGPKITLSANTETYLDDPGYKPPRYKWLDKRGRRMLEDALLLIIASFAAGGVAVWVAISVTLW